MKYYTEEHEWIEVDGDVATVGISEYAIGEYGEVTFVELPEEDDDFIIGDRIGGIEADGEVYDFYAPIGGTVSQINDILNDSPDIVNDSPEGRGWICRLVDFDTDELSDMMDEDEYYKYTESLR